MNFFKVCFLIVTLVTTEQIYCQKDSTYCYCINLNDSIGAFIEYEELASFPGGTDAMMRYIKENIRYPQEAIDNLLEDKVYIKLCVTETGNISNIEILKGKYEILNQEAYRVVSKMPEWKPARLRGRNVCCPYTLPVTFKLDRITKREIRKKTKKEK